MVNIVDRVGSGDAFASGFLDGFLLGKTEEACIDFAIASAAIKHTIPGDINYISRNEVENLAGSDGEGRVVR
ncbi:MAG: PfkB family carbohydrate kinase, partial [Eubacterium sp.]